MRQPRKIMPVLQMARVSEFRAKGYFIFGRLRPPASMSGVSSAGAACPDSRAAFWVWRFFARLSARAAALPGLIFAAAFLSFLLSVGLWFSGDRERGLFVGIWVPSILSAGALLLGGNGHE